MYHTKRIIVLVLALLAFTCSAMVAAAANMAEGDDVIFLKTADNFIIMHDSSQSMGDQYGTTNMQEIEAERRILEEMVATLPPLDWWSGIYTFTPDWSMSYFKPYLTMRTYNKQQFEDTIQRLPAVPAGPTQLEGGLVGLAKELENLGGKTVVFLFTDGQYTEHPGFRSPGVQAQRMAEAHDVCFKVISTAKTKKHYKAVSAIAAVNECSEVVPFSDLLGHPEWLTDVLFKMQKVDKVDGGFSGDIFGKVLFDFDEDGIKEEGAATLDNLAAFLKKNPKARTVLAGHTDSMGGSGYNMKLSQRRAESARAYLVDTMAIDKDRITLSWFGKSQPVADNNSAVGRAENRRVTIVITGM